MPILTVENVDKTFDMHVLDDKRVVGLDDVSFAVDRGEFLAVVGESGSGKSSLLKCIYRTYEPSSGSIRYRPRGSGDESGATGDDPTDRRTAAADSAADSRPASDGTTDRRAIGPDEDSAVEVDLATCDERTVLALRRDSVGYASQFLDEIPRVPAVDVVARPLVELGRPREDARDRAETLLSRLRLPEELWDAYPATFSGGERQRVNLAQALAPRPELLLLDEPTSALDPETRELAIDLLREHVDGGTTVVGVFHDADVVEAVADRVAVLEDASLQRVVPVEEYGREVVA